MKQHHVPIFLNFILLGLVVIVLSQVTKWMEDNCRAKAHQVEKIRVSIGSVRADIRKLSLAAQQLAEKGEDDADQVIIRAGNKPSRMFVGSSIQQLIMLM